MAGTSPCVAREMKSRMGGGSGCLEGEPGSFWRKLRFYLTSLVERRSGGSHKAGSAERGDKMSVKGASKVLFISSLKCSGAVV